MPAKIRLARCGKRNSPYYHIVVAGEQKPRDGRFIEVVGTYDPRNKEKKVCYNKERVDYWLGKGASPTETVSNLLKTKAADL